MLQHIVMTLCFSVLIVLVDVKCFTKFCERWRSD